MSDQVELLEESDEELPRRAVELRHVSQPLAVRFPERVIEVIAVPYDTETVVEHKGRLVRETIAAGAFDGVQRRSAKVPVVRDHDMTRPVGRVLSLRSQAAGLVADLKIGRGQLGDETLDFADDAILDASIGFLPMPGHEHWSADRRSRTISKAYLDHIALVPNPAYETARVLAVRSAAATPPERVPTPLLDSIRLQQLRMRYDSWQS